MIPNYSPYGQNDVKSPYASARPDCTTCGCPMEDMFSGPNGTTPTSEWWECRRCGFKKDKFVKEPPKSIVISFSQPKPRESSKSPVPIDETAHFDKLKPMDKITKLFDRGRETAQLWCPTCSKWKTTIPSKSGKKTCPVCKYSESQESQPESRIANS